MWGHPCIIAIVPDLLFLLPSPHKPALYSFNRAEKYNGNANLTLHLLCSVKWRIKIKSLSLLKDTSDYFAL